MDVFLLKNLLLIDLREYETDKRINLHRNLAHTLPFDIRNKKTTEKVIFYF